MQVGDLNRSAKGCTHSGNNDSSQVCQKCQLHEAFGIRVPFERVPEPSRSRKTSAVFESNEPSPSSSSHLDAEPPPMKRSKSPLLPPLDFSNNSTPMESLNEEDSARAQTPTPSPMEVSELEEKTPINLNQPTHLSVETLNSTVRSNGNSNNGRPRNLLQNMTLDSGEEMEISNNARTPGGTDFRTPTVESLPENPAVFSPVAETSSPEVSPNPSRDIMPPPAALGSPVGRNSGERKEGEAGKEEGGNLQKQSWLLRLFESKLLNMSIAIHYLFNSKEPGVLSYLGNRLFSFSDADVDFYLPQVMNLYINFREVAEVLHPYLVFRCRKSVDFSLQTVWLLESLGVDRQKASKKNLQGYKLRNLILSEELRPLPSHDLKSKHRSLTSSDLKKTHQRSRSDATAMTTDRYPFFIPRSDYTNFHAETYTIYTDVTAIVLKSMYNMPGGPMKRSSSTISTKSLMSQPAPGDLSSGRAFDTSCSCFSQSDLPSNSNPSCHCNAPRLAPEQEFVKSLFNLGHRLMGIVGREGKTQRLIAELAMLNLNLPARVWLPIYSQTSHYVVRIPHTAGCVLNSKDKAPYCVFVEVLEVEDVHQTQIAPRLSEASLHHSRSEDNLLDSTINGDGKGNSPPDFSSPGNGTGTSQMPSVNYSMVQPSISFSHDDAWSQDDDDVSAQFSINSGFKINAAHDTISQMSMESETSNDSKDIGTIAAGDIRRRLSDWVSAPKKQLKHSPEDPSASALSEPWEEKLARIRDSSPYGRLPNWKLLPVIVKTADDLRQELLAFQLLSIFKSIWEEERVPLWVKPYRIIVHSHDSGMIEPILNAVSLHQVMGGIGSDMFEYFKILMLRGLIAARKHHDRIMNIVEIMGMLSGSHLPCFRGGAAAIKSLRDRFHVSYTEEQLHQLVDTMVEQSKDSWTTRLYDHFQYMTNGISQ